MNPRRSEILSIAIPLLMGLLLGPVARGQCPLYWTYLTQLPDHPTGRQNHAMVYDSARGRTVLFGGRDVVTGTNQLYGETWEFDGYYWEQRFPAHSPPARYGHVMTYDAARRVTVLFGGGRGLNILAPDFAADLWEWNGNDWVQVPPSGSRPLERSSHGMAYDSVRGVHVMFGGVAAEESGGGVRYYGLADTWEYDGAARSWTLRSATNAPTDVGGMVFDEARNRTVLVGGTTGNETLVWEANQGIWFTFVTSPNAPRVVSEYAVAYDSTRGIVTLFGGRTSDGGTVSDTWEFVDGMTWQNKKGLAGEPYFHCCPAINAAIAYDSRLRQMVLFGGYVYGPVQGWTSVLQPKILFVDWRNSGTQDGRDEFPFRTIRQAVDNMECGTIRVQPGDYPESPPFTINKPLKIQALNGPVRIH